MNYMDAVKTCLTKYIDISGRATRSEYWWFSLFLVLVMIVISILSQQGQVAQFISAIIYLGLLLPSFAVTVRRLHDHDKSGWFLLLAFIPIVGSLILLYWFVLPGTPGPNRFGA